MNEYDIKRLALILAVQAEIEGMKAYNIMRESQDKSLGYGQKHFSEQAEELRQLASKHNEEL